MKSFFCRSRIRNREVKMNKNLYTLSLCLSTLLFFGCTSNLSSFNQEVKKDIHTQSIVDLSKYNHNIKTNKSIKVNINPRILSSFRTESVGSAQSVPSDIKSYMLNLCTDPTKPLDSGSKVMATSLPVDRDIITNPLDNTNNWSHTVTFLNVPPNTLPTENYYATIQAFDDVGGVGNNITEPNNGSTPYSGTSTGAQIAVSTNYVHFANDQILHFNASVTNTLDVDLKLKTLSISSQDFQIDSGSALNNQKKPSVSANSNGNGLMVWMDDRGANTIYARQLRNYIPLKDTDFVLVSGVTNKIPSNPVISININGNGLVVWQELDTVTLKNTIKFKKITSFTTFGTTTNVATTNSSDEINPDVKIDENGNGLVVWSDNRALLVSPFTAKYGIYYKKIATYIPSGIDAVLSSNSTTTQKQSTPKIMINNAGEGLAVWEDELNALNDPDIMAVKILNYAKSGSDFRVDQDGSNTGLERLPNLSLDYSGNGLVVWKDSRANVEKLYYRKIVGFNTMPINETVLFDTSTSGSGSLIADTREPSISLNASGKGLISWSYNDLASPTIPARKIYASNVTAYVPNSSPFIVDYGNTTIDKVAPFISINSAGNGIISWQDGTSNSDIYARNIKAYVPQ